MNEEPKPSDELSPEEKKYIRDLAIWETKRERSINQCERLKEKSDEHFETQFIFISSGTLLGSFYILEKIFNDEFFKTQWKVCILISWILLGASIVVNLFSHLRASKVHDENFHQHFEDDPDTKLINKRNDSIKTYNRLSIWLYIVGLLFFLLFFSINFYYFSEKKEEPTQELNGKSIINNNYMYNTKDIPSGDQTRGLPSTTSSPKPAQIVPTPKPKQ